MRLEDGARRVRVRPTWSLGQDLGRIITTEVDKGNFSSDLSPSVSKKCKAAPHLTHGCARTSVDVMQGPFSR